MSTIQEIEAAITKLSQKDYSQIRNWFFDYDNDLWDKQIEEDAKSGRLNKLLEQVEDDITRGKVKPLDEILRDE